MSVRVRLSQRTWDAAVKNRKTRAALDEKARQVAARARQLAAAEGVDMTVETSSGVRPRGRTYARVSSPDGARQEWGTSRTGKRRILGRAGEAT